MLDITRWVGPNRSTPLERSLAGSVIVFRNPSYSRTTAYRIARVEQSRLCLGGSTVLGRGRADKIPDAGTIVTAIIHEYAHPVAGKDTGFFQGKLIRSASGATAHVTSVRFGQPMTLRVDNASGFRAGEAFTYYDLQVGDTFEVPLAYRGESQRLP